MALRYGAGVTSSSLGRTVVVSHPSAAGRPLAVAVAAVTSTAALGTVAVDTGSAWYRGLDKPAWQPPAAAFGPVWTCLYASMAWAGARAWNGTERPKRRRLAALGGANLALNVGWNVVFFRAHRPKAAVVTIAALEATTLGFMLDARRHSPAAAAALVPYAAWTAYAAALNATIARRN